MSWTDEALGTCQRKAIQAAKRMRAESGANEGRARHLDGSADLYRLARLGLAAQQMGQRAVLDEVRFWGATQRPIKVFLEHPAWEAK